jgi:hypothetical protein
VIEDWHCRDLTDNLVHVGSAGGNRLGRAVMRADRLQFNARSLRAGFLCLPHGGIDRDMLRVGQAARQQFGFLRQIDHAHALMQKSCEANASPDIFLPVIGFPACTVGPV